MINNLRSLIELHEGRIPYCYADSLGNLTIGVGHLVDKAKGGKLPEDIIDALLDHDIRVHAEELRRELPWVKDLDPVRYAVLVDMAFNLGVPGLLLFRNTLGAIKAGDMAGAAESMLKSRWATQVGSRAKRLAGMLVSGQWPDKPVA